MNANQHPPTWPNYIDNPEPIADDSTSDKRGDTMLRNNAAFREAMTATKVNPDADFNASDYGLPAHVEGLHMNDLITLNSVFEVLAHRGSYDVTPEQRFDMTTDPEGYQDQATWYELAIESDNADGFDVVGDYDTRAEAQQVFNDRYADSGVKYMISKRRGLSG